MSRVAICVENLSKRYRIGARARRARTLREALGNFAAAPWRHLRASLRPAGERETLWALRDVSFEVGEGEVLGLIGPNGAGKSTLLKVLSRITEPTGGRALLYGRVSSLLEVGTGFHGELTGRENIYLNGAILGMTRREITGRFDEIVAFSGLETFIDTPVKRYSSGMFMRLAFAVAAHLEPEILLVDEVLAVGDAEFRKKCLGKMGDVARSGRTVVFVSHNMGAVRDLCPRSLWIRGGRVVRHGPSAEVVQDYLGALEATSGEACRSYPDSPGMDFQVRRVRILDHHGEVAERHDCDQPVTIELLCQLRRPIHGLRGFVDVARTDGTVVLASESRDHPPNALNRLPIGTTRVRVVLPPRTLGPGEYQVHLRFQGDTGFAVESPEAACRFYLDDHRTRWGRNRPGFFSTLLPWEIEAVDADRVTP